MSDVSTIQAAHRRRIVDAWGIPPGAKILEIGCGQGDMTAVLAEAVGLQGFITAVDVADGGYGAPMTLAEATAQIESSPLGRRIQFNLGTDVLHPSFDPPTGSFEIVVLAHASWYFDSIDTLSRLFERARGWAPRLCFAEWDLNPPSFAQFPHFLAITIQGLLQLEVDDPWNVRTPFSRVQAIERLRKAGWQIAGEKTIEACEMQDADWEIQLSLRDGRDRLEKVSPAMQTLAGSLLDVLEANALVSKNASLPVYALSAVHDSTWFGS